MKLNQLTVLAGLSALAVTANAATLGEQYVGVQGSYIDGDYFDGAGMVVDYNMPILQQERFGLDANIALGYANLDYDYWSDDDAVDVTGSVIAYLPVNAVVTPFVSVQIGNAWVNAGDNSDFVYGGSLGVQLAANEDLSFTLATGANRSDEANETIYNVGVAANYWLTDVVGLQAGFSHLKYDEYDTDANVYSAGVRFRF